jgi:hypothetical protein
MDITLYEFNALDEHEKGAALWEYGVFLFQRFEGETGYSLYQINSFYVEVKYDQNQNKITRFTSFSTTTKLEPNLQNIDISELINQ